jgi:hypothetical protein
MTTEIPMRILSTVIVLFLASCSSDSSSGSGAAEAAPVNVRNPTLERLVGSRHQFEGIASSSPHIKENDPAVKVGDETIFLLGDKVAIPLDQVGQVIVVTGKVVKMRWPMFIWDFDKQGTDGVPQGMPMPPGTNIEKDSVYYGLEAVTWKLK